MSQGTKDKVIMASHTVAYLEMGRSILVEEVESLKHIS
jgi:hypothetical protein